MKKRLLGIVCGIVFSLFVGYHLLVCLVSGIAPFTYAEARIYMVKAAVFSLLIPTAVYGLLVWVWKLLDKIEFRDSVIEQLKKANSKSKRETKEAQTETDIPDNYSDDEMIPYLVSAFAQEKKLSDKDKEELLKYLEDL